MPSKLIESSISKVSIFSFLQLQSGLDLLGLLEQDLTLTSDPEEMLSVDTSVYTEMLSLSTIEVLPVFWLFLHPQLFELLPLLELEFFSLCELEQST